ncbi:beta-glucosidase family protein [Granulicoccus phenolivorans]|uniref:beta-glucosidase family protein n=1 Tax=Granulicoccus phenolivorans TaxID=266854 RepID=UPI00040DBCB5|nr:glycoside hydrolase family 3 C-terminal domain-containing protein [Granulicoccus phenolivorans]
MTGSSDLTEFRAADIPRVLAQLTLPEKASLLSGSDFWHTRAIPRLGIPAIMLTDGPHGLRKQAGATDHLGLHASVPATCFPSAAGLGSTWDRDLVRRVGAALGAEARAEQVAVLLGPGINMKRTPLCGRNFEYFSEDPHLTAELAVPMVVGVQSAGVGTSLKHFAVNNQETDRMRINAEVDDRTLREIYLAAFEQVVTRAQPWTVMCSYNRINGTYASQDPWLLTELLRGEWRYPGLVVSDWGAVDDRVAGVAAGLDLEMPSSGGLNTDRIVAAVRSGELAEADVDRAATRVLTLVARAGEAGTDPAPVDFAAHHALAREVAAAVAVLLTNNGVLPLDPAALDATVLIGELARTPRYQGAGSSKVNPTRLVSILDALTERGLDLPYAPGYRLAEAADAPGQDSSDEQLRTDAVDLARGRTAVLVLGLPAADESEGYDRDHLELPESQRSLLAEVAAVADRVVVLLAHGAVVTVAEWIDHADAVLDLWLGGQAGGQAAVDLLLGEATPSGRLAESIPRTLAQVPAQLNFPGANQVVRYGEGLFIGYRGLDATGAEVSFPFGHGLTYTTFAFGDLTVTTTPITDATALDAVVIRVEAYVSNTGDRAGVAVPQLYLGRPGSAIARPPRELRDFARIPLEPGATARVEFTLTRRALSHWDTARGGWAVEPGPAEIAVGASSRDLPLTATVEVSAPQPRVRLDGTATVGEWLDDPEAGPALRAVLGQSGADAEDPTMDTFLRALPMARAAVMSLGQDISSQDIVALMERHGAETSD